MGCDGAMSQKADQQIDLAECVLRNAANGERHAVRLRFRAIADVIRKIDAAP